MQVRCHQKTEIESERGIQIKYVDNGKQIDGEKDIQIHGEKKVVDNSKKIEEQTEIVERCRRQRRSIKQVKPEMDRKNSTRDSTQEVKREKDTSESI